VELCSAHVIGCSPKLPCQQQQQQQPKMKQMNWSMAVDELFAMDGVDQEQDDNDETNYRPENAYSSF
jgi:hypothetical protein